MPEAVSGVLKDYIEDKKFFGGRHNRLLQHIYDHQTLYYADFLYCVETWQELEALLQASLTGLYAFFAELTSSEFAFRGLHADALAKSDSNTIKGT